MSLNRKLPTSTRTDIHYTILGALTVLSLIIVLQSSGLIWRAAVIYERDKEILAVNYDNDIVLQAASSLLNERGITMMALNLAEPIGAEDRAFVDQKRSIAKTALDKVLEIHSLPGLAVSEEHGRNHRLVYGRVLELRQAVDAALLLPREKRDPALKFDWFRVQSALLDNVKNIYILNSRKLLTASETLTMLENVKLAALEMRYTAGIEISMLASGIGQIVPPGPEHAAQMSNLIARTELAYEVLQARAALIDDPRLAEAFKILRESYFAHYSFLRDQNLGLAGNDMGGRWSMHPREFKEIALPAVATIEGVLFAVTQLSEAKAKQALVESRNDVIVHVAVLLLLLASILALGMALLNRVLKPLKRLQTMVDSASDGILTIDARGMVETVNPGTCRMFGYREEEILGNSVAIFMLDDSDFKQEGKIFAYLEVDPAGLIGAGRDLLARKKDGAEFPIHLSLNELWDEGQRKFTVIMHDISALKHVEQEIVEAERKLREVTDRFPGCVYQIRTKADGRSAYEFVSSGVNELWGIEAEAVLEDHHQLWDLVHRDDKSIFSMANKKSASNPVPFIPPFFRIQHPDGNIRWLSNKASLRKEADGSTLLTGCWVDITEQKRLEQQAAEAEQHFLDITNGVPGVVFQFVIKPDQTMRFSFVSQAMENIFDLSRETAMRDVHAVFERVVAEDLPDLQKSIIKCARSMASWKHEFRIVRHGKIQWCSWATSVPRTHQSGGIVWNGYLVEISERKEMEYALHAAKEMADRANSAKSGFLATMSHEIRTPMNGVLGMLELLGLTQLTSDQRNTLNLVEQSGKELLSILDDILDFSKIEAGKFEIRSEITAINDDVIENIFRAHVGKGTSKGLCMTHKIDPNISPALWVDSLRLRQILHNFMSNALKFTTQGSVDLSAELLDRADGCETIRFSVSDTGIGITPENQRRLFQPFVQAEADTTRRFGGTGLGLTICKGLATRMGGAVAMESELGKGSKMMLTLRLTVANALELAKRDLEKKLSASTVLSRRPQPTIAEAEAERSLVLAVDDHSTNRRVIMRQLNALGYAVETARNGVEALQNWQSGRYSMIITDCEMPEMDGYSLARAIRAREIKNGDAHIPIIACTANAYASEVGICLAAGMDDYLSKPTNMAALARMFEKWLPISTAAAVATVATAPQAQPAAGPEGLPVPQSVPSAISAAASPLLDPVQLAAMSGGDAQAEYEILLDFRGANQEDMQQFQQAFNSRNIEQLTHVSHGIKGAAKMIGATQFAAIAERLEHAGRANDWILLEANIENFHDELARLNHYLDSRLSVVCNQK